MYLPAAIFGRPAKVTSWVLSMALAISTDEATTTGNDPNLICMMGPYFWEREWIDWWGSEPMRLRLPIMGQDLGPGGKLSFRRRQRRRERRMRARVASHAVK